MFKISYNTVHRFSFAEILVMVAINELETKRKLARSNSVH